MLHKWVMKYNSHEKLKASGTGGMPIMTNGRKTTYDERVEIVKYCIEHQNNYAETAQKYQVSYQQVYMWTNKYESVGVEGLQDRRGKRKDEDEMSELEKLKAQNKLLEAQNRRQQMEIDFLKKLEEIERRRY
jgi:transposase-like protein